MSNHKAKLANDICRRLLETAIITEATGERKEPPPQKIAKRTIAGTEDKPSCSLNYADELSHDNSWLVPFPTKRKNCIMSRTWLKSKSPTSCPIQTFQSINGSTAFKLYNPTPPIIPLLDQQQSAA